MTLTSLQTLLGFHNWWNGVSKFKNSLQKDNEPLRIGVLSAALINPTALFDPIDTHPGVVLTALAARTLPKAQAQIAKYKLKNVTAYGSYAELVADTTIDAIYIPLPNGLHCEWAIKSMEAGKHVLIEKPIASNADEAELIRQCSLKTDKVALEAFHWQFHPAAHRVKQLVDSGEYGEVRSIYVKIAVPSGALKADDIRFHYQLAGGACMDLTYVFSAACYFANIKQDTAVEPISATPRICKTDPKIDEAMNATFALKSPGKPSITCTVDADLLLEKLFGFIPRYWALTPIVIIELEKARIHFDNFAGPWVRHSITLSEKDQDGKLSGKKKVMKCYKGGPQWGDRGEDWWTTYRYQLETFCNRVKAVDGAPSDNPASDALGPWLSLEESAKVMSVIDTIYEKAGLPKRGLTDQ